LLPGFGVHPGREPNSNANVSPFGRSANPDTPGLFSPRWRRRIQNINPEFGQEKGKDDIILYPAMARPFLEMAVLSANLSKPLNQTLIRFSRPRNAPIDAPRRLEVQPEYQALRAAV
jgi:hypothetical protein